MPFYTTIHETGCHLKVFERKVLLKGDYGLPCGIGSPRKKGRDEILGYVRLRCNKFEFANRLLQRRKSAPNETSCHGWGSPVKRPRGAGGKLTTRFSRRSNSFSAENPPRRHSIGAGVKDVAGDSNSNSTEEKLRPSSDQIKRLQSIASVHLWSPRGKRYVALPSHQNLWPYRYVKNPLATTYPKVSPCILLLILQVRNSLIHLCLELWR